MKVRAEISYFKNFIEKTDCKSGDPFHLRNFSKYKEGK